MSEYTVVQETFRSEALQDNPWGDPADRTLSVLLPPGYDQSGQTYPMVLLLTGFLGAGQSFLNWQMFDEDLPQRLTRLHAEGNLQPCVYVLPDCSTYLGGSQYRNSPAVGSYADYVCEEIVPYADRHWRITPGRRGVIGKSSGGYGALVLGMERPDLFCAVVSHSGDCYFDYCYRTDFPQAINRLVKAGGLGEFLEEFHAAPKRTSADIHALNIVAMAACYSPDTAEPGGIALPFELPTGKLRPEVWSRWLENDPVEMAPRHVDALRGLDLLFLDCGFKDEWHLHLGMRILSERLRELDVPHEVQEFDDNHRGITYRMDVSLPLLTAALKGEGPPIG